MKRTPTLSESAAPFARFAEASDVAFNVAATVEDMLRRPMLRAYTLGEIARAVEPDIAELRAERDRLENAYTGLIQLCLVHGLPEDELKAIARRLET